MPSRKDTNDDRPDPSAPSIIPEGDDAEDPRTFEHPAATAVREGELSAAQLPEGHGNVDPNEPDAQYPPGVVDNRSVAGDVAGDPADFVPEAKRAGMSPTPSNIESAGITGPGVRNTAATPDYGTSPEE